MSVQRLVRVATATAIAGACWLVLLLVIAEASSTSTSVMVSICTLFATAASLWLIGLLLEREDGEAFRIGGDAALRAQVAVTRALTAASGNASRAELFARLAHQQLPLSITRLDHALGELERAGVVISDFDDEVGERVYRLVGGGNRVDDGSRVSS